MLTIGGIAGGLGLFLLAVTMITDGLRLAAGDALSDMLGQWTRTPGRGIASGVAITGLVQSSSAVTVAAIGFVNAGIIAVPNALGVIFGANVGTTMTGWLVATLGFKVNVAQFALPLIGVGMFFRLLGANNRRGALGTALAGFGLFFIGIDVLKNAFESLAVTNELNELHADDWLGVLIFVWVGFFMTVLTQSSSAAIAIVLTAATGGVVPLTAAAALVIGANVGTTSTAALAVIGATPNAKRVASAHILFNVLTALIALSLLPYMLSLSQVTGHVFGLQDVPAVTLALFHTVFNVLGVLLIWPNTLRLASFLEKRFRTAEELESKAQYLDKTLLNSPGLAYNAICLELGRVSNVARRMAKESVSMEMAAGNKLQSDQYAVKNLVVTIETYVGQLGRTSLPEGVAVELPHVLRTAQYLFVVAELAQFIANAQPKLKYFDDPELMEKLAQFRADLVTLLSDADIQDEEFSLKKFDQHLEDVDAQYHQLKDKMMAAAARQQLKIRDMSLTVEQLSRMHRLSKQLSKAVRMLARLYEASTLEYRVNDTAVNQKISVGGESE